MRLLRLSADQPRALVLLLAGPAVAGVDDGSATVARDQHGGADRDGGGVARRVRAGHSNPTGRVSEQLEKLDVQDPAAIVPREAALAHLRHWWREPMAGAIALIIGCWDTWHFGKDAGLSSNIDELLVLGGIVLIAGSSRLFNAPLPPKPPGKRDE
jgi:hypothetical protein